MPLSSLPSKYGIGDFGKSCFEFIDLLTNAGVKFWQLLPLNPLGGGNSPYQSICSYAIDPIYIDLSEFYDEGLVDELESFNEKKKHVDYPKVRAFKMKVLHEAFKNQRDTNKVAFKNFLKENPWIDAYARYLILREKNNYQEWWFWPKEERYDFYKNTFDYSKYKEEILFTEWCQYIAYKQYLKLKKYANEHGIKLMGDIPFYVGSDSSDAWSNQDEFLLDENDRPRKVAGVPPDYFNENGQRWGNLIYDWEYMKDDNFTFWISRVEHASKLFDYLRIDHFRAFDTYWAINPECPTAIDGKWEKAYGEEFFNELKSKNLSIKLFAEDLGELAPGVEKLRDEFELPGMNVVQFTILNPEFKEKENQIIYTDTHDNDTLKGWILSLNAGDKELLKIALREKNISGRSLYDKLLNYTLSSECDYACIPIWDYLKLDSSARMNTPGTCGSPNWEFRLVTFADFIKIINDIKGRLIKFKR